jgi:CHRD domain
MKLRLLDISIRRVLALAAALILSAPAGYADTFILSANLTGALEFPPVASPGIGQATVIVDTTLNTMEVKVTFSGLTSGTTAAHIHCCLPSPFATGINEPVVSRFPLGSHIWHL